MATNSLNSLSKDAKSSEGDWNDLGKLLQSEEFPCLTELTLTLGSYENQKDLQKAAMNLPALKRLSVTGSWESIESFVGIHPSDDMDENPMPLLRDLSIFFEDEIEYDYEDENWYVNCSGNPLQTRYRTLTRLALKDTGYKFTNGPPASQLVDLPDPFEDVLPSGALRALRALECDMDARDFRHIAGAEMKKLEMFKGGNSLIDDLEYPIALQISLKTRQIWNISRLKPLNHGSVCYWMVLRGQT
eukprot:454132_1